ncbi:MAG TPA: 16S rRNA (cytosine(967)-C(5))-methyltransferase RsmB [archaeon]|nr:16S rRNA (cytosine(967)-C(5))-methyltransferase RsmB [archaeon]
MSSPRLLALAMLDRWKETDLDWDRHLDACSSKDRALVRQLVSGTLRMQGKIDYYLGLFLRQRLSALPQRVRNILRMAVFQLKFCDRIPDYAIVYDSVEFTKNIYQGSYGPLVNGVLRNLIRKWDNVTLPSAEIDSLSFLTVNYSHPEWLVKRYLDRFGFHFTQSLLEANNIQAPLVLRLEEACGKKTSEGSVLRRKIEEGGLEVREGRFLPEALVVTGAGLPRASLLPGYSEGLFYVQDEAAMLVAHLAAPVPGSLIFDFCAAPGGKSTHLARLAGKDSLVVASDLNRKRLEKLNENIQRLGLNNLRLLVCDARLPATLGAGLVLCDVPCTGTGVLRRKPELRWRIKQKDLAGLTELQREILEAGADACAPGGTLVYSTCSLEPEENWGIVSSFLAGRDDFHLDPADKYLKNELVSGEGCLATFPNVHGIDGAFAARLVRKPAA